MKNSLIRNFAIIAHIDHGKSTLSDRFLELCHTVSQREVGEQMLDTMELEQERGITIKLNCATLMYQAEDGQSYELNLIDTPGHVDFTYEVSRSLAACEGAILVVDATQGVQAQTIANVHLALENNLTILPVINKVDLDTARPEEVKQEVSDLLGLDVENAIFISAKTGAGVPAVLEQIVALFPPPVETKPNAPLKALIFDSYFDQYRGVILFVRIHQGEVHKNDIITLMAHQKQHQITELGIKTIKEVTTNKLTAGQVGWIAAGLKKSEDVNVGDTVTLFNHPAQTPLPGYKKQRPLVYCGFYCVENEKFSEFKKAINKISLSDASFTFEAEHSPALGFGYRCGFLGLLHMEIIQERLEREYQLNLIATVPNVIYQVVLTNHKILTIYNPSELPHVTKIKHIKEPFVKIKIFSPHDYIGKIMGLCQDKRGVYQSLDYLSASRVVLKYEIPLSEIIYHFFNQLKSVSKGYASFDYEFLEYRVSKLVKLDFLLNHDKVEALSLIVERASAYHKGQAMCLKLKEFIPSQNFEIPIQAAINNKIIARSTVKAVRKDVIAKCYGGDITRKRKLLEAQKKGKKRLKAFGKVVLPQEAFLAILQVNK